VHRSGLVVTAAHVIASCGTASLRLINFEGKATSVKKVKIDAERRWVPPTSNAKILICTPLHGQPMTDLANVSAGSEGYDMNP